MQNKHQFPVHIIGIHTIINQNSACICSQPLFLDVKSYESNEPVKKNFFKSCIHVLYFKTSASKLINTVAF